MNGFDIISKLGDGAYSIVYKVRRKRDGKIYALKKVRLKNLTEKEKENSLNEIRILASIKSTFVISYKEAFIEESEQSLCLVMEYADKGDLYQKITQLKKKKILLDEVDVWRIFIQMTKGLKALHDLKILHRDFKSANIFLFSDGSAKIGDLNVSKVAKKGLGYTQTGTPYYASPEVWNDKPYGTKSDIWGLACVTYEMLTLHPPFRAENMDGLYEKVIKGKYEKINKKYSEDMSEILRIMFKVNPLERPSCDQILKHPIILKRIEFFQSELGEEMIELDNMDDNVLLKTIRISDNLLHLADKLPKSNYENIISPRKIIKAQNTSPNFSLPNITNKSNNKKGEFLFNGTIANGSTNSPSNTKSNKRNEDLIRRANPEFKSLDITNRNGDKEGKLININKNIGIITINNNKKKVGSNSTSTKKSKDACLNGLNNIYKLYLTNDIKITNRNKKKKLALQKLPNINKNKKNIKESKNYCSPNKINNTKKIVILGKKK